MGFFTSASRRLTASSRLSVAVGLDHGRQLRAVADPKLHLFHIICNGLQIYFCIHPIVLIHFFISSMICHSVILCRLLFPSASFRHSLIPPIRSSASRE